MFTSSDFNGDLSSWKPSSVSDMSYMFSGATAFNRDLSNWDVTAVTDMSGMFNEATSFNGDLTNWKPSSVTDMKACSMVQLPLMVTYQIGMSALLQT